MGEVVKLKKEVLSHYSKNISCVNCNESELEFLAIDHIASRKSVGHSRSFGSTAIYRWLKKQGFPSGYQVLCHNCNMIKEVIRRRSPELLSNSYELNIQYIMKNINIHIIFTKIYFPP